MSVSDKSSHMVNDYKVGEGNMIGYLPTEFTGDVENSLKEVTLTAGTDIKKGQVVKVSDSYEVNVASTAADAVLGVAMFDTEAGEPISVETEGLFKLTAGAAINVATEAKVTASDNGTVAPVGESEKPIGIAINNADAGNPVFVKFSI